MCTRAVWKRYRYLYRELCHSLLVCPHPGHLSQSPARIERTCPVIPFRASLLSWPLNCDFLRLVGIRTAPA